MLAGARVASYASVALLHGERAKAAQLNAIAARERVADLSEDGVDDVLDVTLVEVGVLVGDPLHKFRFNHEAIP